LKRKIIKRIGINKMLLSRFGGRAASFKPQATSYKQRGKSRELRAASYESRATGWMQGAGRNKMIQWLLSG